MTTTDLYAEILSKLGEVRVRCPEFRFGQLIAAIGSLAEGDNHLSLWDIEDVDFLAALDQFASDVSDRPGRIGEPIAPPDPGDLASSLPSIVSQPPR